MDKDAYIENIENTIQDMVSNLLYYDRKEDEDLPVGKIQDLIKDNVITPEEITSFFEKHFNKGISYDR